MAQNTSYLLNSNNWDAEPYNAATGNGYLYPSPNQSGSIIASSNPYGQVVIDKNGSVIVGSNPYGQVIVNEEKMPVESAVPKKRSRIARFLSTTWWIYAGLCGVAGLFLIIFWKNWIWKFALGCDTRQRNGGADNVHIGTNVAKGLLVVVGGFDPLVSPPKHTLRIGRPIDTPMRYDVGSPAEMRKKHSFIAWNTNTKKTTPAFTLNGGKYFLDIPSSNGDVGFGTMNYRLLGVYDLVNAGRNGGGDNIPPNTTDDEVWTRKEELPTKEEEAEESEHKLGSKKGGRIGMDALNRVLKELQQLTEDSSPM